MLTHGRLPLNRPETLCISRRPGLPGVDALVGAVRLLKDFFLFDLSLDDFRRMGGEQGHDALEAGENIAERRAAFCTHLRDVLHRNQLPLQLPWSEP